MDQLIIESYTRIINKLHSTVLDKNSENFDEKTNENNIQILDSIFMELNMVLYEYYTNKYSEDEDVIQYYVAKNLGIILKNIPIYVSIYLEERYYGGPEEGGWYYTHTSLEDSKMFVNYIDANKYFNSIIHEYMEENENCILNIELIPGTKETKTIPIYC